MLNQLPVRSAALAALAADKRPAAETNITSQNERHQVATVEDLIKTASSHGYQVSVTYDRRADFPGGPVHLTLTRARRHQLRLLTLPPAPFSRPSRHAAPSDYVITNVTVDDTHVIAAGSSLDVIRLWHHISSRALSTAPHKSGRHDLDGRDRGRNRPAPQKPFSRRRAHLVAEREHGRQDRQATRPRPHRFGGMHVDFNFTKTKAA